MSGILFLWLMWGIWVYTTFLLDKAHPGRFMASFLCLLLIVVYPFGVRFESLEIAVPAIVFALICFYYIRKLYVHEKMYMLIAVLTVGMFYAGIGFIAIYDPVLIPIEQRWIVAAGMVILALIFYGHPDHAKRRSVVIVMGSLIGEFFLGIPLIKIGFTYSIGGHAYLDTLAVSFGVLIALKVLGEVNLLLNFKTQSSKGEMKNL
ncbi:YphA family membrane protein [Bacillus sp. KH172YL63]|uniref:YphA family membrane protein n=1 Tax=Bacillus sp. KH172YL63 TaxID=2709784 RepID=UPI0013E42FE9|nr:hypothetical protein [Bacillus sp. KH172YL63]BCB04546.1 hypothetical protein KH172YL63_26790 [Bacillus sp. KH172YL63]